MAAASVTALTHSGSSFVESMSGFKHQVMTQTNQHPPNRLTGPAILFRAPRRISITLPYETYSRLLERSSQQGRSLSNLAAFLLESALGKTGAADPINSPCRWP